MSLIALAVIISTDFAYEDALYDYSVETLIPNIQQRMPSEGAQKAWLLFTDASYYLVLPSIPIITLFIIIPQRARCIYYCFSYFLSITMMITLKAAHHGPRPFWHPGTEVQVFHCSAQYGNPSGHTSTSFSCLLLPWLDYCTNFNKADSVLAKPLAKIVLLILALTWGCLIAFSRMYLGVHSLD